MFELIHVLVIAGVGAVSYTVFRVSREASLRRNVLAAPRSRIADIHEGARARVVGSVIAHAGTVTAAFSGKQCVYFEVTIDKRPRDVWEPVLERRGSVPFAIQDDSGRAIVDPDGAAVTVDAETTEIVEEKLTSWQTALLADASDWLEGRMRVVERRIDAGDVIAVVGGATREPDPSARPTTAAYRGESPTRVRFASSPRNQLLIMNASTRMD